MDIARKGEEMDIPWDDVVFVSGHPRAGTTWVSNVLGQAEEANYIFEPLSANREPHRGSPYVEAIQSYLDLPQWFVDSACGDAQLERVQEALLPHTIWLWRKLYGDETGKSLCVKQPQTERLGWFVNVYRPRAVICVKRHPLGIINSYRKLGAMEHPVWRKGSSVDMLRQVPSRYPQFSDWLKHAHTFTERLALMIHIRFRIVDDVLRDMPHLVVRYEDLCISPVEGFSDVFHWLDWSWNDSVRSSIEGITSVRGEDIDRPESAQVRMPSIRRASDQRSMAWLNELSPLVIFRVWRLYRRLGIEDYRFPGGGELPYSFGTAIRAWYRDTRRVVYLWLKSHGLK